MAVATEIILNPNGNHGQDGRHWMAAQRLCLRELAPAEVSLVESSAQADQVARQSALKGYGKIVAVGDQATAHGVVNGVMSLAESHRREIKVGFLSFARPDPWSRTLALPRELSRQLEILRAGHTLPYDVGRLDCRDAAGGRLTRHFLNGAWFGVMGALREEWRNPDTTLLEALPRLAVSLRDAASPSSVLRLESRGGLIYEGPCSQAMVMGGRYYRPFGPVAPSADPSDGMLELAWLRPGSVFDLMMQLSGLWLRRLSGGRSALAWQSVDHVRATSLGRPVTVEADGQPVGRLPANLTTEPRALEVMVAPVAVKLQKPNFVPVEKMKNGHLAGNIKSAAGL